MCIVEGVAMINNQRYCIVWLSVDLNQMRQDPEPSRGVELRTQVTQVTTVVGTAPGNW